MQQTSPALGKNQPKTFDCSFQEAAIGLHQRLDNCSLLLSHQRLHGGNLTIHISKFLKLLFQNTALVVTGLTGTQNPIILLKFILVTYILLTDSLLTPAPDTLASTQIKPQPS